MTPKEAIEILESEISKTINTINALPEKSQTRATDLKDLVNAYLTAIEALEKQEKKKPIDVRTPVVKWGICPVCKGLPEVLGSPKRVLESEKYCSTCGQAIDWSEEE